MVEYIGTSHTACLLSSGLGGDCVNILIPASVTSELWGLSDEVSGRGDSNKMGPGGFTYRKSYITQLLRWKEIENQVCNSYKTHIRLYSHYLVRNPGWVFLSRCMEFVICISMRKMLEECLSPPNWTTASIFLPSTVLFLHAGYQLEHNLPLSYDRPWPVLHDYWIP